VTQKIMAMFFYIDYRFIFMLEFSLKVIARIKINNFVELLLSKKIKRRKK